MVVLAREVSGRAGGFRQRREEARDALLLVDQAFGQLPDDRAQLVVEREEARCEEVRERGLHVLELLVVGDEAASLDRKQKASGGLLVPGSTARRCEQRVEGTVDLERGHA